MKKYKIFVDGAVGTIMGYVFFERLGAAEDIELLSLPESERKDSSASFSKSC